MPEVRYAVSGEVLARLSGNALKTATTRQIKITLAGLWPHVSRFRMRLLRGGRILGEEETPFAETAQFDSFVDCVFVPRRAPTQKEVDILMGALGTLNNMAVEMLFMKGICPAFVLQDQKQQLQNILAVAIVKESAARFGLPTQDSYFPILTEMLIEAHGNVNLAASLGRTPLFVATELGFEKAVALLLTHRADPSPKEELRGECPLHVAVRRKDAAVARLLLDAGADITARRLHDGSTQGETPQELAEATGAVDIIALFSNTVG